MMVRSELNKQLDLMRRDWDARARENALYYVNTAQESWDEEAFYRSGEQTVAEDILTDMTNICQGKDPEQMRVLEIGCGAARVTRALARRFGEVHAVDVSGEMVERARRALRDFPNAHVYQNNGMDLRVLGDRQFDFAYTVIVFQHIPSRTVIERYVREVHRLLRPGALFKFQVHGCPVERTRDDTWNGVAFSEQDAIDLAERCGFENRYRFGAGSQYFWLWFFKRSGPRAALRRWRWRLATRSRLRESIRMDEEQVRLGEKLEAERQLEQHRLAAEQRATENARFYRETPREHWSPEDYFRLGEDLVAGEILTDAANICQQVPPARMKVLELGCGQGYATRALARLFGEVHGVDDSPDRLASARQALQTFPNIHLQQAGATGLGLPPGLQFDFAFSHDLFRSCRTPPDVERYVRQVYEYLRPGGLLKFLLRASQFSPQDLLVLARRSGFEPRFHAGDSQSVEVVWFFKAGRSKDRLRREIVARLARLLPARRAYHPQQSA